MKYPTKDDVQTTHTGTTPVRPQTPEVLMFEPEWFKPEWWKHDAAAPRTPVPAGAMYHGDEASEGEEEEPAPEVEESDAEADSGMRCRQVP